MKGETWMFVGMVDTAVAAVTEGSFIGSAVNRGFFFLTHVAFNLHLHLHLSPTFLCVADDC